MLSGATEAMTHFLHMFSTQPTFNAEITVVKFVAVKASKLWCFQQSSTSNADSKRVAIADLSVVCRKIADLLWEQGVLSSNLSAPTNIYQCFAVA